MMDIREQA
jgi:hypothetical protein